VSAVIASVTPAPAAPYVVGFHLIADFPMMAFAAAIEPLRVANRLAEQPLFEWRLFSRDGEPVRASNGIDVAVQDSIGGKLHVDLLLVCAGTADADAGDTALARWLRSLHRRPTSLRA